MKILQVTHSLPFINQAGVEVYTYSLSLELSKRHEVFIFCRNSDIKQKDFTVTSKVFNQLTVYLVNNTFRYCDSFESCYENEAIDKIFAGLLDEIKPDIIHIQHLVFLSIGIIKKIKERNIPIIFTIHDYWLICPKWHLLKGNLAPCDKADKGMFDQECTRCLFEALNIKRPAAIAYNLSRRFLPAFLTSYLKKIYLLSRSIVMDKDDGAKRLYQRRRRILDLLREVDLFLSPSQYLINKFISFGIPREKIRFSRFGLNGELFRNIQKTESEKIRFAFVGTLLPAKGLHVLIEAFNRIKNTNVGLKIYGEMRDYGGFEYYLPYLKSIVRNKDIEFMGGIEHQRIGDVFREIDILVVPSLWQENSPIVIEEALLSGTGVIASRVGGIPELIDDGVNGLLFSPGDVVSLQEKIEEIIKRPDWIRKFANNGVKIKDIKDEAREIELIYSKSIAKNSFVASEVC